jgi:hypothetical protein
MKLILRTPYCAIKYPQFYIYVHLNQTTKLEYYLNKYSIIIIFSLDGVFQPPINFIHIGDI